MYYSGMGLCSGHGNSVVICELSLYPQSLSAKLTVVVAEPLMIREENDVFRRHLSYLILSAEL